MDVRVAEVIHAWTIETKQVIKRGSRSRTRVKQVLGLKVDVGDGNQRTIVTDLIHILDAESAIGLLHSDITHLHSSMLIIHIPFATAIVDSLTPL